LDLTSILARVATWWATRPTHTRVLLVIAASMLVVELAFRRFGPKSPAYKKWTHFFETIGLFWTAILLAVVYFVSVSFVAFFIRLFGKDLLDRKLTPEPSYWRSHEPNPLGPAAAVRHQF
jgi:hypothetical protein